MSRINWIIAAGLIAVSASGQATKPPTPAHIVIVIEENKAFDDVIGSKFAPYINKHLVKDGALLKNFFSQHHPSQPNYVAFFAGDTLTVCDDKCPNTPFTAENLGSALLSAGKSFIGFAEDLPSNPTACPQPVIYGKKHCPWLDFSNVPLTSTRDFEKFPQTDAGFEQLPTVSLVIPNLIHDMHTGASIATEVHKGDEWLDEKIKKYANWAMKNDSLLIVTWDEDSNTTYHVHCATGVITTTPPDNRIATIIVGQRVKNGTTSETQYTHQDLLRTILDMYAITPFAGAATAKDIDDIWN